MNTSASSNRRGMEIFIGLLLCVVAVIIFISQQYFLRSSIYQLHKQMSPDFVFVSQVSSESSENQSLLHLIFSIQKFYPNKKILIYFDEKRKEQKEFTFELIDLQNVKLITIESACIETLSKDDMSLDDCSSNKHVWWPISLMHTLKSHEAAVFVHPLYRFSSKISDMDASLDQNGYFFVKENYNSLDWSCTVTIQGYKKNSEAYFAVLLYNFWNLVRNPFEDYFSLHFISNNSVDDDYLVGKWLKSDNNVAFDCSSLFHLELDTPHFGAPKYGLISRQKRPSKQESPKLLYSQQSFYNRFNKLQTPKSTSSFDKKIKKYGNLPRIALCVYMTELSNTAEKQELNDKQTILSMNFFKTFLPSILHSVTSNDKFYYIIYIGISSERRYKYGEMLSDLAQKIVAKYPISIRLVTIHEDMQSSAVLTYISESRVAFAADRSDILCYMTDLHAIRTIGWAHHVAFALEGNHQHEMNGDKSSVVMSSTDTSNSFACVSFSHMRRFKYAFPPLLRQNTFIDKANQNFRTSKQYIKTPSHITWLKKVYMKESNKNAISALDEVQVSGEKVGNMLLTPRMQNIDEKSVQSDFQDTLLDYLLNHR